MNDLYTPRSAWNPLAAFGLALGVFVAAFLAGVIYTIAYRVATGHMPSA